jgi:penicillin amidase
MAAVAALLATSTVLVVAFGLWLTFRSSLPAIDGLASMTGLRGKVTIERDAAGVPTISAMDRDDLARGLGFVHGQDRFFPDGPAAPRRRR